MVSGVAEAASHGDEDHQLRYSMFYGEANSAGGVADRDDGEYGNGSLAIQQAECADSRKDPACFTRD